MPEVSHMLEYDRLHEEVGDKQDCSLLKKLAQAVGDGGRALVVFNPTRTQVPIVPHVFTPIRQDMLCGEW
jgi:hypothetical protein